MGPRSSGLRWLSRAPTHLPGWRLWRIPSVVCLAAHSEAFRPPLHALGGYGNREVRRPGGPCGCIVRGPLGGGLSRATGHSCVCQLRPFTSAFPLFSSDSSLPSFLSTVLPAATRKSRHVSASEESTTLTASKPSDPQRDPGPASCTDVRGTGEDPCVFASSNAWQFEGGFCCWCSQHS